MLKRKNYQILILLFAIGNYFPPVAFGQHDNVWVLGTNAGIDFNGSVPKAIKTNIDTREGCASFSDDDGRLLFYTDGETAWGRDFRPMPNATLLSGAGRNITNSTTQGSLIVPRPGYAQQYYVFSLGAIEYPKEGGQLSYSIIDMSLNNSLGDLLPGYRGIVLDSGLTEQMTAVSGNSCDIWLLVVSRTGRLKAYNIHPGGINPVPVLSEGAGGEGILGSIDVSEDGRKIALVQGSLIIMDFDRETGQASNPIQLNRPNGYYSVAFSPDGSKVYASNGKAMHQFDLSSGDSTAMRASKLYLCDGVWGLKRGPDGKIYTTANGISLNVIKKPDLAGMACGLEQNSLLLLPGTQHQLGVTNTAVVLKSKNIRRTFYDTLSCSGTGELKVRSATAQHLRWGNGQTTPSIQVSLPGKYWVSYEDSSACMLDDYVDTFIVVPYPTKYINNTYRHSGKCEEDTIALLPTRPDATGFLWQDGSRGQALKVFRTGKYYVLYAIDTLCEVYSDTFIVTYPDPLHRVAFDTDTIACEGQVVTFRNKSSAAYTHLQWLFGDSTASEETDPRHVYGQEGVYKAVLTGNIDGLCYDTAYVRITVDRAPDSVRFSVSSKALCMGESVLFVPEVSGVLQYLDWDFGDGNSFESLAGIVAHAYDKAGEMVVTLHAVPRICPSKTYTDHLKIHPLPAVDLGPDTTLCFNRAPFVLRNRKYNASEGCIYTWSTGTTMPSIRITTPGTYSLQLYNRYTGCRNSESIVVTGTCRLDIPNAFTPNGDGMNDYFLPRMQDRDADIRQFDMRIVNRWGQQVFYTQLPRGSGWDGKLNAKEQPEGVYIYTIEVGYTNGLTERYSGNVSLMR